MSDELNKTLDGSITKMAEQAKASPDAQKSLHFSQAALNLAHVKNLMVSYEKSQCKVPQAVEKVRKAADVA